MVRAPVLKTLRRSPFDGLLAHASKIRECIEAMREAVKCYIDGKFDCFDEMAKKVIELEHEADLIKGNTRNHLPKFILLPVDRGDFLMLLHDDDRILDYAQDVVVLLGMKRTVVPDDIKDDIMRFVDKVVETAVVLENAVMHLKYLLETSFSGKERSEVKLMIKEVHKKEWECDKLQESITRKLFNTDKLDPVSVYHLLRVTEVMGEIADSAENAADRLRVMIGR